VGKVWLLSLYKGCELWRRAAAGLLQLPVSWLGIRALNGNFTAINVAQIIFLLPIFVFCWMMHRRALLVHIRLSVTVMLEIDVIMYHIPVIKIAMV
jgi:hypothetical protein